MIGRKRPSVRVSKRQCRSTRRRSRPAAPSEDAPCPAQTFAVAAAGDALVTHNKEDFDAVAALGLRVISPQEMLQELGRSR